VSLNFVEDMKSQWEIVEEFWEMRALKRGEKFPSIGVFRNYRRNFKNNFQDDRG
jgi:hypothetical protein